jgi:hypothetical protein
VDNAAFAGVVVGDSVILVCDFLTRPVSRRRDSRFSFSPADDFNAQMVVKLEFMKVMQ